MCKVLRVSKNSYYRWCKNVPSSRDRENRHLLFEIRKIHTKSKASYGSPRIAKELNLNGYNVSRPRVARIMKRHNIKARMKKKFVVTTDSKHTYPLAENVLKRNFTATTKSKAWVSDITYIKTAKGWLYLTIIMDLYDRKVIGWSLSKGLKTEETIIPAWYMAVKNRAPKNRMIFHSDRGVQYASHKFTNILNFYDVTRSMSRKGNCWDNAVAESFFKTLKTELIYQCNFYNLKEVELAIFEWIETWYNKRRRHSALNNLTIDEFNQMNIYKLVA